MFRAHGHEIDLPRSWKEGNEDHLPGVCVPATVTPRISLHESV